LWESHPQTSTQDLSKFILQKIVPPQKIVKYGEFPGGMKDGKNKHALRIIGVILRTKKTPPWLQVHSPETIGFRDLRSLGYRKNMKKSTEGR